MNLKQTMIAAAVLLSGACTAIGAHADVNAKPFTVPEISQWKGGEGRFTPQDGTTRIVTDGKNPEAARIAQMLGQDYTTMTGVNLPVKNGEKSRKGDISLAIKSRKGANEESYTISVTPNGVSITAPTAQGLYWGTRTLLQLSELSQDRSLPVGTATDSPEYKLRGFMLDCGRKYIPMSYLYKLVDAMAYYKMNTLHIHLNDNGFVYYFDDDWDKTQAAFRLESNTFPGLTARDGSYSKKEFRDFVKYAATKGIEVIPEIDVPAHSLAFSRYMPEIGSTPEEYGKDHLNLMEPKTYEFLDKLFAEYMEGEDPVFNGPTVHIGTDEYSNRDSAVVEKFRYLTDRYIRYVEKYGKRPAVWGALTHAKGQQPVKADNVLMYCWYNGYADPKDMIERGYEVVSIPDGYVYIVPNAGYYYDYLNNKMLYDKWTPANIGGKVFSGDTLKQIRGGMFAVWNDHPNNGTTVKDIHHRIMHSLPTMAAKTWNADKVSLPFDEFDTLSKGLSEAPGVNYLARYGKQPGVVLEQAQVTPGSTLPIPEIGYDYTVEFDLTGADEAKGTKLFESPEATFWISDPISGNLAFSREDKLVTFRQNILPGEKLHVKVTGDNKGTRLYVNGQLVDDLNIRSVSYNKGKNMMADVRTLVFPLEKAGDFKSKLTNLKVTNFIE